MRKTKMVNPFSWFKYISCDMGTGHDWAFDKCRKCGKPDNLAKKLSKDVKV